MGLSLLCIFLSENFHRLRSLNGFRSKTWPWAISGHPSSLALQINTAPRSPIRCLWRSKALTLFTVLCVCSMYPPTSVLIPTVETTLCAYSYVRVRIRNALIENIPAVYNSPCMCCHWYAYFLCCFAWVFFPHGITYPMLIPCCLLNKDCSV